MKKIILIVLLLALAACKNANTGSISYNILESKDINKI
jgi:hypothetical protein